MSTEPTKADLKAAVAKLTEQNAALRDLLGAVRSYAEVPHPADCTAHAYQVEMENRLDVIAIWANADRENMNEHVYALVLADRAKELRERAAEPVRYKVRAEKTAEPAPVITDSGRTRDQANPDSGAWCHRDGEHDEHRDTDGETWRTDGAVEFTSDSRLVKTAACTQPEYHGAGLLGGKPNMPVLCDRPEHHAPASVTGGEDRCECSGCGRFRRVVPSPHAEPPAVVSSDVVLEVRALLP